MMRAHLLPIKSLKSFSTVALLSGLAATAVSPAAAQTFPVATNSAMLEMNGGAVFGASNYWVGFVSGTNLMGQRVSTSGQLLGAPITVGSNPGFPPAAALAGARTNALAAWSDHSIASGVTMFGRICSPDSGALGAAIPLLASPGSHGFQRVEGVASDGTNYLVVWRDLTQNKFYGQMVTGAGTLSGGEFFLFDGWGDNTDVAVAFGGTNYLVAWQGGGNNTNRTYCRTVSPGGAPGSTAQISTTVSVAHNPLAVASDGANYLVVWGCSTATHPLGWPIWTLRGRLVSGAGAPLGNERTLVTEQASFPAVAFDGDHFLLAWGSNVATTNTDVTIRARFLNRAGDAIGPVFDVFEPRGNPSPLLPVRGVLFAGGRFLLTATYGAFVLDESGDVVGFNGGDVYGRFLPRSTTPPVFSNLAVANGRFQGQLTVVPGVTYTIELSTNLTAWTPVGTVSSTGTNRLHLEDDEPVAANPRLFYRATVGNTPGMTFDLWFTHFAKAGGFGGGFTPSPAYPVTPNSYVALLDVEGDVDYPSPHQVFFTGPAGSGLVNAAADAENSVVGGDWATYVSPSVSSPAVAPGGNWVVNYRGSNVNLTVPDPQAASRLVVPLPTVSVSGGVLQSVNWVYKSAATGVNLGGAPAHLTDVYVQVDGIVGGRIYNSPELAPNVTSHTLSSTVNWSNVSAIHMAYNDTLGNHYVVTFSKP